MNEKKRARDAIDRNGFEAAAWRRRLYLALFNAAVAENHILASDRQDLEWDRQLDRVWNARLRAGEDGERLAIGLRPTGLGWSAYR